MAYRNGTQQPHGPRRLRRHRIFRYRERNHLNHLRRILGRHLCKQLQHNPCLGQSHQLRAWVVLLLCPVSDIQGSFFAPNLGGGESDRAAGSSLK